MVFVLAEAGFVFRLIGAIGFRSTRPASCRSIRTIGLVVRLLRASCAIRLITGLLVAIGFSIIRAIGSRMVGGSLGRMIATVGPRLICVAVGRRDEASSCRPKVDGDLVITLQPCLGNGFYV